MNALVLGAAGFVGLHVVDALRRAGVEPRCGRRARTNVLPLRSRKAVLVPADLDDPEELAAAMADVDVVFHCAGHYPRHSLDRVAAFETGLRQTRNVLAAATHVRRVVYVSSTATVAPTDGVSDETSVYRHMPCIGVYHDLKWAMEQAFLAHPNVVVACPSAIVGPFDYRVGTSAMVVGLARGMDPPHPDGWVSIVDAADVGEAVVRLALHPDPPKRVILSGPSRRLHPLLVELAGRYGVAPPSPALSPEEAFRVADEGEAKAHAEGGRSMLARELADLIVHGVPMSARLAETTLGLSWTPLSETLDRFDAWARRMRLYPAPAREEHPT
ncbi:MAG: NAD-dependent epimerase/dehydratase family protein [Myxococcota bacterium]